MASVWVETRKIKVGKKVVRELYRVMWREVVFDALGRPGKGKRRWGTFLEDPLKVDKQRIAKFEELEAAEAGLKPPQRFRTVGEISKLYLSHAQMRIPKSFGHLNKPAVEMFKAFVGDDTLADNITGDTFIKYEAHLRTLSPKNKPASRYKPNTIRRFLKDLRTFLRFAHDQGWINSLPKMSLPAAEDSERLPTQGEVQKIFDHLAPEFKVPFLLAAHTGFRLTELLSVQGQDFSWSAQENHWELRATILKRRPDDPTRTKIVPIQQHVAEALGLPRPPGQVFTIKARALQQAIEDACKDLGIEHTTPHDLRHYAATRYMEWTGDLYGLMRMFGWKDIKSAMKYQHLTKGRPKAMLGVDFGVRTHPIDTH